MGDYYPLDVHSYKRNKTNLQNNKPSIKYKLWISGKEETKINHIEFSNNSPYKCSITSGTKVLFANINSKEVTSQYASFKNIANCTSYRNDDKLFATADDNGLIQIIDSSNRGKLRRLKEHEGPVRTCRFLSNKTHLVSGGDDKCVKVWDIVEGKCIHSLNAHTDSIRQLASSPSVGGAHLFLSASYDGSVKLWDLRIPESEVISMNHSAPVEDIIIYPKSLICASSGGTMIKLWDFSTGNCVHTLSQHAKTVTSLAISSDERFLFSSSLDRTVKWTYTPDYTILKSMYFEHEIMKMALSSDDDLLAVGLSNGDWSIRKNKTKVETTNSAQAQSFLIANKRSRSSIQKQNSSILPTKIIDDFVNFKNSPLDKFLRSFQYKEALDTALTLSSAHVVSLIEELIQRGALYIALGDRDETTILPTLQFITRNIIADTSHTSIVLEALYTLLEENEWIYKTSDPSLLEMFKRISQKIGFELMQHSHLQEIQGVLDMILSV